MFQMEKHHAIKNGASKVVSFLGLILTSLERDEGAIEGKNVEIGVEEEDGNEDDENGINGNDSKL